MQNEFWAAVVVLLSSAGTFEEKLVVWVMVSATMYVFSQRRKS